MATRATVAPVLDGRTDDPAWIRRADHRPVPRVRAERGEGERASAPRRASPTTTATSTCSRACTTPRRTASSRCCRAATCAPQSEQLKLVIDSYHDKKTALRVHHEPGRREARLLRLQRQQRRRVVGRACGRSRRRSIRSAGWRSSASRSARSASRRRRAQTFGLLIGRDIARTGQRISWPLLSANGQGYVSQAGDAERHRRAADAAPPRDRAVRGRRRTARATSAIRAPAGSVATSTRAEPPSAPTSSTGSRRTSRSTRRSIPTSARSRRIRRSSTSPRSRPSSRSAGRSSSRARASSASTRTAATSTAAARACSTRAASAASPQLVGEYGDATSPTATPIAAAAKLTGRLANGFSVGLLDAVTQRVDGVETVDGRSRRDRAAHQLQRRCACSETTPTARATWASCSRASTARSTPARRRTCASAAYTGGLDLRRRFVEQQLRAAQLHRGERRARLRRGHRGAADATPSTPSSVRTTTSRYDPTRTSLRGDAERVSFSKFGGGITRFQTRLPALLARLRDERHRAISSAPTSSCSATGSRCSSTSRRSWYRKAFFNFNAQEQLDHRRARARQRLEPQLPHPAGRAMVGARRLQRERAAATRTPIAPRAAARPFAARRTRASGRASRATGASR